MQALHLVLALPAFLLGSVPTAYILVRRHSGKDIRREGSGNVGTLNAYEVSRSRGVGLAVLLLDAGKGAAAVVLAGWLTGGSVPAVATSAIAVVLGHNYTPWLGGRGGRGLAPAAGALAIIDPMIVALWMLCWLVGFIPRRNVHDGNITASIAAPAVLPVSDLVFSGSGLFVLDPLWVRYAVVTVVCVLVLVRHAGVRQTRRPGTSFT